MLRLSTEYTNGGPYESTPIAQFVALRFGPVAVVAVLTDDEREWSLTALQTFVTRVRFIAFGDQPADEALIKIRAAIRELDERTREPGGST